jgi:DNA-binding beta-propeller fold protein YncE
MKRKTINRYLKVLFFAPVIVLSVFITNCREGIFVSDKLKAADAKNKTIFTKTTGDTLEEYEYVLEWGGFGIGPGQLKEPGPLDIDSQGYVYVGDRENHRIQKFTSQGEYILEWGEKGRENGQFDWLVGIAIDHEDYVYATDIDIWYVPLNRGQKFSDSGNFILSFGQETDLFDGISGLEFDSPNNMYVCDRGNHRIIKFNSKGEFTDIWTDSLKSSIHSPTDIDFVNDNEIYIYCGTGVVRGEIIKLDENGYKLNQFGRLISGNIAVDKNNGIYVTDMLIWGNEYAVKKYNSDGKLLSQWGKYGYGHGEFAMPQGIVVDDSGYVYVADYYGNRVQKFRKKSTNVKKLTWSSIKRAYR